MRPRPASGRSTCPDDGTSYAVDVIGASPAPALDLDAPEPSGSGVSLAWQVSDPDDEATVDLYYDTDLEGQDGVLIAEDLPESQTSYSWDTGDVPTGTYYVYAIADDGKNAPVVSYASNPAQIVASAAPAPPGGVSATAQDTSIAIAWNRSDRAARYTVYYAEEDDPTFQSPRFGVGDTTAVAAQRLAAGRTYHVAVTASDSAGRESPLSEVAVVSYESQTQNNAPLITTTDPAQRAREGETYRQPIAARDADGDALTYELARSPDGMAISSVGEITWTPEPGQYRVQVRVRDPEGAADSLSYELRALSRAGATARVTFSRSTYVGPDARGQLTLTDPELNRPAALDSQRVVVRTQAAPSGTELLLRETQAGSGQFRAPFGFSPSSGRTYVVPVNAADTLSVTYEDTYPDTTVTASVPYFEVEPPRFAPRLAGPAPEATAVTTFPTLAWGRVDGAGRYRVQVATDSSFRNVVQERVVQDTSLAVDRLEKGTAYLWRVRAENVVSGPWSEPVGFATQPAELQAEIERTFGGASEARDYRLVALPGAASRSLVEAVSGAPGIDWQAYWDDGSEEDYLIRHDGSETFRFRPGRGFWLTSTTAWSFDEAAATVDLKRASTYAVGLHEGWNIIANPYAENVTWEHVGAANSDSLRALWRFDGAFAQTDTFRSARAGEAFYVLNDIGLDSLSVPYPNTGASKTQKERPVSDESTSLITLRATNTSRPRATSTVQVGTSRRAAIGLDRFDVIAPPSRFAKLSLRLHPRQKDVSNLPERYRSWATDVRPPTTEGYRYRLTLRGAPGQSVRLRPSELDAVPGQSVALLDVERGQSYDLRREAPVELTLQDSTRALRVVLGSEPFVQAQTQAVVPDEMELLPNYPNPFSGQTTLEYALPEKSDVRVAVYDVLGREVQVLERGEKRSGVHRLRWNGRNGVGQPVASGLYFVRLKALGQQHVQKVTLVR